MQNPPEIFFPFSSFTIPWTEPTNPKNPPPKVALEIIRVLAENPVEVTFAVSFWRGVRPVPLIETFKEIPFGQVVGIAKD